MTGRVSENPTARPSSSGGHSNFSIAAVIIGRNEGERLIRCLDSVRGTVQRIVYVDSGSTDGSIPAAKSAGAEVVDLDISIPFTAARARNAGIKELQKGDAPDYVQFIDGDCELRSGWIASGSAFLDGHPAVAVVSGRLREKHPEASLYNRLCDREWNTPIGQVSACGGIAMIRWEALNQAGGFKADLIAGEEPELCVRLRSKDWEIWRLDEEMGLHDAAMTRFGQWWKRARRSGYAAAEGMALHGALPERHGVPTVRRALFWAFALPATTLAGAVFVSPLCLVALLAYPAQVARLALRAGGHRADLEEALFLTLGKFPELQGMLEYCARRLARRPAGLIEYK